MPNSRDANQQACPKDRALAKRQGVGQQLMQLAEVNECELD